MKKKNSLKQHTNWGLIPFCAPALILVFIFFYYPTFSGVNIAFYNWNGIGRLSNAEFVGLGNFIRLVDDTVFWNSVRFSLLFMAVNVVVINAIAILLASLLANKLITGSFLRILFFAPNIIPLVATALMWLFLFSTAYHSFAQSINIEALNIDWFGGRVQARATLFIVTWWVMSGYLMIIYLAGLKSIDTGLLEAAAIDGCSGIRLFFKIKLPLIMPSVVICMFLVTNNSIRAFDLPFLLTNGGPFNSTATIPLDIFQTAFTFRQFGYASAKSLVLLALVMIVTFLTIYSLKRRELEG